MKICFKTSVCKAFTTIACATLMFAGALGINSIPAKASTVKYYTVDLSNSKHITFDVEAERKSGSYSSAYKDALVSIITMVCYTPNIPDTMTEDDKQISSVMSSNPLQGIIYRMDDIDMVDVSAVAGSTGTGKYVISSDLLAKSSLCKGSSDEANMIFYFMNEILEGRSPDIPDTNIPLDIVYNIEIKYSDAPIITTNTPGVAPTVSFAIGKEFESNGVKYRINDAAGNLSAIGLSASSKTVIIPDVVTYEGYNMNVTDIAPNFMKGNKNAKKVTIGANVSTIGSKAFYNCKKLKKVVIASKKISKIGTKAFGKNAKGFTLKLPKSCKKSYKKLLKKAKIKL